MQPNSTIVGPPYMHRGFILKHPHQRQVGCPQTHTKNTMVQNLQLLFDRVPTTTIHRYGSLKDWFNVASDEKYWTTLVQCLPHLMPPSLSGRQHGACHHIVVPWFLPHLPHPQMTGTTRTPTLSSLQHHCEDAPPQGNPCSHSLQRNPPQCHKFLTQNNG
jgi:hypothetical protein